jgi:putative tricarboxylic transport membrane protein
VSVADDSVHTGSEDDSAAETDGQEEVVAASSPIAPVVFGALVLAVGVVLLWQGWLVPGDFGPKGPRFLPVMLAIGWILLAAAYLAGAVAALIGRHSGTTSERLDHPLRLLALVVALIAYAYVIAPLGYLISTSVLFAVSAAIMGSRNHIRDAIVAVGLTVAVYYLFSRGLSIYLPPGVLPL